MKKDYRGKWDFKNDPNFSKIDKDIDRHWAMERALLIGKLLLDEDAFVDVVRAINSKDSKHLDNALIAVGLTDPTNPPTNPPIPDPIIKTWLWNYLYQYKEVNNWTGTGW